MKIILYASTVGSLIYVMLYTSLDICIVVGMVSRYPFNLGMKHWMMFKHILKYLQRTRDYMLVYNCNKLLPLGYMDLDFQFDRDSCKSTSIFVFTLAGRALSQRNVKQFVEIEALKARHDVTKLDFTIPLLPFQCIVIDLSIWPMSLTLYMTWVHSELHRRYKLWFPCKQINCP